VLWELDALEEWLTIQRKEDGCRCSLGRCGGVEPILEQLSHRPGLAWAYEAWQWSCAVTCQAAPLVPNIASDSLSLEPATYYERAELLGRFLAAYVNYGLVLLKMTDASNVADWKTAADAIGNDPRFEEALNSNDDALDGRSCRASFSGLSDRAPTGRRWPSPHPATGAGPGSSEMASR